MQREDAKRQQEQQSQRNHIEMRDQWRQGRLKRNNPLTKMLIILSVLVTLLSGGLNSGKPDTTWQRQLMFADSVAGEPKKKLVSSRNPASSHQR